MNTLINKNLLGILASVSAMTFTHAQSIVDGADGYTAYWRQFHFEDFQSGGSFVRQVNITGQDNSDGANSGMKVGVPIRLDGSVFQLIAVDNASGATQIVAETFAAPFQLSGDIEIERNDPWVKIGENGSKVYRCRADWFFGLTVDVDGLKTENQFITFRGEEIPYPINLREARWGETVYPYNDDFEIDLGSSSSEPVVHVKADQVDGGDMVVHPDNTRASFNLLDPQNPDFYTAAGEYHFQLRTVDEGMNSSNDAVVYANAVLQVFPKTKGEIKGITPAARLSSIPEVFADLDNLYPHSLTSFRVIKLNADGSDSAEDPTSGGVSIDLDGEKPVTFKDRPLDALSSAITDPGKYRLEIVHLVAPDGEGAPTTFQEEILADVEFSYEPLVEIGAGIFTNE